MLRILISFWTVAILASLCSAEAPAEKTLVDQEVTVLRGDFKEIHFLVPEDGSKLQFQGSFQCAGGFNDDITFLAMAQNAYVRWFSHYDYRAEVKMEKKKNGTFRFEAKPGETYYFVFDNFFSSVSNKKIKFRLKLAAQD